MIFPINDLTFPPWRAATSWSLAVKECRIGRDKHHVVGKEARTSQVVLIV
jgi:hypothetical protein